MKGYRCGGCRQRFPLPPFARVGLSSACSSECATDVRRRSAQNRGGKRPPNAPPPAKVRKSTDDIPQQVRSAVVLRDRARCRFCGKPSMELHHIRYRSEGGGHEVGNLICLCREHHGLMHSNKRYYQPILLAVIDVLVSGRTVTIPEMERRLSSA